MHKTVLLLTSLFVFVGLGYGQTYVGSDACEECHGATDESGAGYNIHAEFIKSGHPYKLNPTDDAAPVYPANTSPGLELPTGHVWTDFDYVIGGYGWKARFIDTTGHIFTGDELSADSVAQYNLDDGSWVRYHVGETKEYNYGCFVCHTTGPSPDSTYNLATPGLGTFAEPGVGCEGCHGPGSDHIASGDGSVALPVQGDSLAIERCGECHQRGGITNAIPASGGYIRHHEQLNEMRASRHGDGNNSDLTCEDCHYTHIPLLYPEVAGEGLSGISQTCEDCHGNKVAYVDDAPHSSAATCLDCHMPEASKSALAHTDGNGKWGDIKTHIWAINTDPVTSDAMFTEDGGLVALDADGLAAVTMDYSCLRCHTEQDVTWASGHAKDIHQGENKYLGVEFDLSDAADDGCVDCHGPVITEWEETGHSAAWDSVANLPFYTDYSCVGCHTTGFDTTVTNWGADEYVIEEEDGTYTITDQAKFDRVKNVQCEQCHGPVGTPDSTVDLAHMSRTADLSADLCGACHTDDHHPTWDDWSESLHAVSKETSIPGGAFSFIKFSPSCSGCHTAEGFLQYLEQEELEPDVIPPGMAGNDLTCAACHDPHAEDFAHQLRMDKTELCQKCHNPLYNPDSPEPDGEALHHTTAYMLEGKGGWEYEGYSYPSSLHQNANVVSDRCVACHVFSTPIDEDQGIPAYTGHTFEPHPQSCDQCHSDFAEFWTPDSSWDYRGTQSLVDSLMHDLENLLASASSADSTTDAFYRAKFNWDFVHGDGSHGIHNTDYAVALLESAITEFTPVVGINSGDNTIPLTYKLDQNYPNPFNPTTEIRFSIKQAGEIVLKVYNIIGQEVAMLVNGHMKAGQHQVTFEGADLASGIYIYRIVASDFTDVKKMVLIK